MTGPGSQADGSGFRGGDLDDTVRMLSSKGVFGLLWLDETLIIRQRLGLLVKDFDIGEPVTASLVVLIGQDERIEALRQTGATTENAGFHIPNFSLMSRDGEERIRMNVSVFWRPDVRSYLVLLARVLGADVRDLIVEDEIRKRRIADAELARINEQLEEFAYVISHDLKAPLRALKYHAADIRDALAAKPPDSNSLQQAAGGISAMVQRMSNMLEGLLEYSRIGRQREQIERVDTSALAASIISTLPKREGFKIEQTGAWPVLNTVAVPLDVTLRNLIENAIKHHDRNVGTVRVIGRDAENALVIEITDDGPGIPPEWHAAIFEPFKQVNDQLHPDSSGIGLALVKRTIDSLGGRIEVQSDPAKTRGTTFVVVWPKRLQP